MTPFWGGSGATTELGQWARHLLAVRDTLDVDGRVGASFVAASPRS